MTSVKSATSWFFLTNHSHVLLCLVRYPSIKMKEIAVKVGITERAVQRIIADLHEGGYIVLEREGRCNKYKLNLELHLRHAIEKHRTIEDLISFLL